MKNERVISELNIKLLEPVIGKIQFQAVYIESSKKIEQQTFPEPMYKIQSIYYGNKKKGSSAIEARGGSSATRG